MVENVRKNRMQYVQVAPPSHQRCRFFKLALITTWMVPLLVGLENATCMFFQREFQISICLTKRKVLQMNRATH